MGKVTHESVSPGFAGLPVGDDHSLLDVAELVEVFSQALVGGVVGQTAHEDLGELGILLSGDGQHGGCGHGHGRGRSRAGPNKVNT